MEVVRTISKQVKLIAPRTEHLIVYIFVCYTSISHLLHGEKIALFQYFILIMQEKIYILIHLPLCSDVDA